jgi:hypothetical protein
MSRQTINTLRVAYNKTPNQHREAFYKRNILPCVERMYELYCQDYTLDAPISAICSIYGAMKSGFPMQGKNTLSHGRFCKMILEECYV